MRLSELYSADPKNSLFALAFSSTFLLGSGRTSGSSALLGPARSALPPRTTLHASLRTTPATLSSRLAATPPGAGLRPSTHRPALTLAIGARRWSRLLLLPARAGSAAARSYYADRAHLDALAASHFPAEVDILVLLSIVNLLHPHVGQSQDALFAKVQAYDITADLGLPLDSVAAFQSHFIGVRDAARDAKSCCDHKRCNYALEPHLEPIKSSTGAFSIRTHIASAASVVERGLLLSMFAHSHAPGEQPQYQVEGTSEPPCCNDMDLCASVRLSSLRQCVRLRRLLLGGIGHAKTRPR